MLPSISRAAVAAPLLFGFLSACNGPACGTYPVCDIREASCQAAVWAEAQCARDVRGETIPSVRVIDVDTYRAELEADLAAWEPEPDDRHLDLALDLLDLVPMDATRAETSIDDQVATVSAYYTRADGAITIIDRGAMDDVSDVIVLHHEMVHALQDRAHDLTAFYGETTTHDEAVARSMVVEGEAAALMYVYYLGTRAIDPLRADWAAFFDAWLDEVRGTTTASGIARSRLLAYPLGGRATISAWLTDTRAARRAFDDPPPSTVSFFYDALRGETAPGPAGAPVCDATPVPPGARHVLDDTFGATVLYAFIAGSGRDADAWMLARAWTGDRVTVVASEDGEHTGIAWRIRVRDVAAIETLVERTEWFWSQPLHGMFRDGSSLVLFAGDDPALFEGLSAAAAAPCP